MRHEDFRAMKISATAIGGLLRMALEPHVDARGAFARLFCVDELARAGVEFAPLQMSLSRNPQAGTLRGLHYQVPPDAEAKIVRAVCGAIYDVVVDLRRQSPTYRHWLGVRLDAAQGEALLVPEGCAHGFITLEADTDVHYLMNKRHVHGRGRGIRYDDPAIGVRWPQAPQIIAPTDLAWPPLG